MSTVGWKTGKRHQIEIWFVEREGRYYIVSEREKEAHWVQNIMHEPSVTFRVSGSASEGKARILDAESENELATKISGLMKGKYGWGDGLIVELTPEAITK